MPWIFVLEVTAWAAADLLGTQANSTILFYRKIREVISYHLALDVSKFHHERINHSELFAVIGEKSKRRAKMLTF